MGKSDLGFNYSLPENQRFNNYDPNIKTFLLFKTLD